MPDTHNDMETTSQKLAREDRERLEGNTQQLKELRKEVDTHNEWEKVKLEAAERFFDSCGTRLTESEVVALNVAMDRACSALRKEWAGEEHIKKMANRFLQWKLPAAFNPDGGITFKAVINEGTSYERKREPVGTNLFSATQAEEMVRFLIEPDSSN